jgi:hypothetical protein
MWSCEITTVRNYCKVTPLQNYFCNCLNGTDADQTVHWKKITAAQNQYQTVGTKGYLCLTKKHFFEL